MNEGTRRGSSSNTSATLIMILEIRVRGRHYLEYNAPTSRMHGSINTLLMAQSYTVQQNVCVWALRLTEMGGALRSCYGKCDLNMTSLPSLISAEGQLQLEHSVPTWVQYHKGL